MINRIKETIFQDDRCLFADFIDFKPHFLFLRLIIRSENNEARHGEI